MRAGDLAVAALPPAQRCRRGGEQHDIRLARSHSAGGPAAAALRRVRACVHACAPLAMFNG